MKSYAKSLATLVMAGGMAAGIAADEPSRRVDLPVPIGHEVKGLRVPLRTSEGKMDLQFDMESATRLDDQNVEMHTALIQTFDQQSSKPDVKINLKKSVMNMETNVITSQDPILVTRSDFQLTADGMEFNSKTRQGKVYRNIRLLIYNRNELQKKSEDNRPK
jgi:hypothetical protein